MFAYRKLISRLVSLIIIFGLTYSGFQPVPVTAQSADGIKRQVNMESGRVSFIGPESGRMLAASRALGTLIRPQDPALELVNRFGAEFGLKNPQSELSELKSSRPVDGRVIVRYQQNYQGIPVMGGELIVNTNQSGDLYSINGEVSPDLSLPTQPKIDSAQARDSALQAMAKWYQKRPVDFAASEPELWIFDESLLQPSTRPVELVWRMEVTAVDHSLPVRELVLVNAERGNVSLHFNQIDTIWKTITQDIPTPIPALTVSVTPEIGTSTSPMLQTPESEPMAIMPRMSTNYYVNIAIGKVGAAFTHAFMVGSPVINAGNPAAPGSDAGACLTKDQRRLARPVDSRCDIGAYGSSVAWMPAPLVNTYTAGNSTTLPGSFLCNQTDIICSTTGDVHAQAAHKYALGTYNLYATKYLRDSIDNNGMTIISSVRYSSGYQNAYWSGTQMVYGDAYGFPLADDVVAHELTHGVTQHESNLFYFYQSGAINESLSDVWGEYYDQTNGLGNDTPAVKWLMGEDISGLGALRSMSDPPAFGDPDKMTSANYEKTDLDNGGVHTNSGVNNKAVFLMVDGGTFNGKTITALGWDKTAAIYYETNTNLLSSGSDYSDLYYAVQQACVNLTGKLGITAGDCQQVKNALDAVEMNAQPVGNFNPDAAVCAAGMTAVPMFKDDMESGTSNWVMTGAWSLQSGYASSPVSMMYGDDFYSSSNSSVSMAAGVALPVGSTMYLHFKHAFAFEYDAGGYYDGGVLEFSINNGTSWVDASPLFVDGQNYKGTILNYPGTTNTLKGRGAFVGDSHGYVSSRYNLTSLGGKSVKFRWRFATDSYGYYLGWMVDDVQIYSCSLDHTISGNTGAADVTLSYIDGTARIATSLSDGSYSLQVSSNWSGTVTPSYACYTFSPDSRSYSNVSADQTAQDYTPTLISDSGCATVKAYVGGVLQGGYTLPKSTYNLASYPGVMGGPLYVDSTTGKSIVTSIRLLYNNKTLSELMGVPTSQLLDDYSMPMYVDNGTNMDSQIRFTNTSSTTSTTVQVYFGGTLMGTYPLGPSSATRVRFAGITGGPVRIVGTPGVPILAGMRIIYGGNSSFDEMMAYPATQLASEYWFPFYTHNNTNLKSDLRIANTSSTQSSIVNVYFGGALKGTYTLLPNTSRIVSYPGVIGGPVRVAGSVGVPIITSMGLLYNNKTYSELMGVPTSQLLDDYSMPVFLDNNGSMDSQIRFTNTSSTTSTTVQVFLGGTLMGTYPLGPSSATRVRFAGVSSGPIRIVGTPGVPILAGMRIIYGGNSSFDEIMAYPTIQLESKYWFPYYSHNQVNLDTEVRMAVP